MHCAIAFIIRCNGVASLPHFSRALHFLMENFAVPHGPEDSQRRAVLMRPWKEEEGEGCRTSNL